jgi:hypothetical protein
VRSELFAMRIKKVLAALWLRPVPSTAARAQRRARRLGLLNRRATAMKVTLIHVHPLNRLICRASGATVSSRFNAS